MTSISKQTVVPTSVGSVNPGNKLHTKDDIKSQSLQKCCSMTLAISSSNANRMLEASRALNASMKRLGDKNAALEITSFDGNQLIAVVRETKDTLLCTFLDSMLSEISTGVLSPEEMKLCLLLFFDMDKSSKLLSAFDILTKCESDKDIENNSFTTSNEIRRGEAAKNRDGGTKEMGNQANCDGSPERSLPSLNRTQMRMLFQSFLTSISTCINFNDTGSLKNEISTRKSIKLDPSHSPRNQQQVKMVEGELLFKNDENKENNALPGSSQKKRLWHVKREIEEIAKYAADKVFDDIKQKQKQKHTENTLESPSNETAYVEFQHFGEWYNSGGYSLVPWLELLDLAKWDYAGRSAASAEAASRKRSMALQSTTSMTDKDKRIERAGSYEENIMMNDSMEKISLNNNKPTFSPAMPDMFLQSPTRPMSSQNNAAALSKILISFNFSGARKDQLSITRENLLQLQRLVTITDFSLRSPAQIANVLLRRSKRTRVKVSHGIKDIQQYSDEEMMILSSHDFSNCIRDLIPSETLRRLSSSEIDSLMNRFTCFFLVYGLMNAANCQNLGAGYVNAKELAVGLSFLCNGNKSTKLASTFELIGDPNFAYLSQTSLLRYIRSYLTMLGSISLLSLSESSTRTMLKTLHSSGTSGSVDSFDHKLKEIFNTVEYGSRWTLDHFLRNDKKNPKSALKGDQMLKRKTYFEDFASWYTDGGFKIAPWLEFLDLRKFMSLLDEKEKMKYNSFKREKPSVSQKPPNRTFEQCFVQSPAPQAKVSSSDKNEKDVLFTFPLANKQNLVVLREDAAYVRTVVDHLGLLHLSPDEVWDSLYSIVRKKSSDRTSDGNGKGMFVDQKSFVTAVEKVLPSKSKRKCTSSSTLASTPQETLVNFFQSFDLKQVDRVSVNQLMGGLTLLCGGKKSTKLSFAFNLFNFSSELDAKEKKKKFKKRQSDESKATLCGKELFYFFRSFLIVMFSCCKQSLDLSADAVGRYISDTANMVTDEVMKYQWRVRRIDRVNFVDFGEWYNEGGFETAPWLELLDLTKWVLLDEKTAEKLIAEAKPMKARRQKQQELGMESNISKNITPKKASPKPHCPSPPPDHEIDQHADNFFDEIEMDGIGGDIGDMGFLFEKDGDDQLQNSLGLITSTPSPYRDNTMENERKALKFQLFTNESNAYTISISPQRVLLLRQLVIESNLCNVSISTACDKILEGDNGKQISRDRFNSAMHSMIDQNNNSQGYLRDLFSAVFNAFDFNKLGKADATELACGLTVLCGGRKSDKLEYAFELLDKKKRGLVSRFQMVRYLQSFLLVLLNISSCPLDSTEAENILIDSDGHDAVGNMALARVICGASSWATEEIFNATPNSRKEIKEGTEHIDFDNFADWYTKGGYNRIAWLELLDLKKWVLSDD